MECELKYIKEKACDINELYDYIINIPEDK